MRRARRRKCCHCNELYSPDERNRKWQRYCSKAECRRASKARSQRRWSNKAENRDYFKGPLNVERVRAWRKKNPGYWRKRRSCKKESLQDVLGVENGGQPIERTEESGTVTLQDIIGGQNGLQPLVMIGLIAKIAGTTLQDDIAMLSRSLVLLGQDILQGPGRIADDSKAAFMPQTGAAST